MDKHDTVPGALDLQEISSHFPDDRFQEWVCNNDLDDIGFRLRHGLPDPSKVDIHVLLIPHNRMSVLVNYG